MAEKIIINLIQDLATPHNNVFIEQFLGRADVDLKLWYARAEDFGYYQWKRDISNQHITSTAYGSNLNLSFLRYCMLRKNERFVIVGWMNINTRILHLLFFLFRRTYNHWTDRPNPHQEGMTIKQKALRWASYRLLRFSRCSVFGVGKTTVDCFRNWGFPDRMLTNLPIFVSVDDDISAYRARRVELHTLYDVPSGGGLLVAGSRLIFEKGYDLLIQAIAEFPQDLRRKTKLVIVGSGEESNALKQQIASLNLQDSVCIEDWLDIEAFKALIANSDIFVHPARFDAYGGTILAMALGVAVIGSTGAGAAVDRIIPDVNGLLYEATDIQALACAITQLLDDDELRLRLAAAGRRTALKWHPRRGVDILMEHSI